MKSTTILLGALFIISGCAGTEETPVTETNDTRNVAESDTISTIQDTTSQEKAKVVSANNQVGRDQSIVATAQFNPDLSTFFELIRTAQLTVTLESQGNYTVFAPTNRAFQKMPAGTLEALKQPVNRDELTRLIRAHLLEDKKMASDLRSNSSFKTMLGLNVNTTVSNDQLKVGDATVIKEDIDASNGVVHIIDRVLIPPKE